jgi:hypothetical protein
MEWTELIWLSGGNVLLQAVQYSDTSPAAVVTSAINAYLRSVLSIGKLAQRSAPTFKITTRQTRAERRGVAQDMGGRLREGGGGEGVNAAPYT